MGFERITGWTGSVLTALDNGAGRFVSSICKPARPLHARPVLAGVLLSRQSDFVQKSFDIGANLDHIIASKPARPLLARPILAGVFLSEYREGVS